MYYVACRFIGLSCLMRMRGRKNTRLQRYDYSASGYYFITIVTRGRAPLFRGRESLLEHEMHDTVRQLQGTGLDYYVVMSDHIHAIVILSGGSVHIGEVVRRLKAKVSHAFGQSVWQANYYEHVIRNDRALCRIREYIQNNPQALLLKFDQFYK